MSTTLNTKELTLVYDSTTSEGKKALAFATSLAPKVNKQDVIINAPAKEESVELLLPEVYESFFKRLEAAVLDRTGVDKE